MKTMVNLVSQLIGIILIVIGCNVLECVVFFCKLRGEVTWCSLLIQNIWKIFDEKK